MPQTFRATVEGDLIRWLDAAHPDSRSKPVEVRVVVLDKPNEGPLFVRTPGDSGGEACFGRYRIPVWLVVQAWQMGRTDDEILAAHPVLTQEHLAAGRTYYRAHRLEIDRVTAIQAVA